MFCDSNIRPSVCLARTLTDNTQSIEKSDEFNFDRTLKEKWEDAKKKGVFRYILNIKNSKFLTGKYQFLAQLNTDRGHKRRFPQSIISLTQPFDEKCFNFTHLPPEEKVIDLNEDDIIAINVSPIEYCHSLLIPERCKQLPQVVTKYSLYKALDIFLLSHDSYIRVAFNSLCAYSSVNHLHWHLYYLNHRMLLEYIDLEEYMGPIQILRNYPANGFCIKQSNVKNIDELVNWAFLIIDYLQTTEIAHNIYITRAMTDSGKQHEDLRIYIWARKSSVGIKDTNVFIPAVCEFFGHLSIKCNQIFNILYYKAILGFTCEKFQQLLQFHFLIS
ncbi:GDP-D-glucose phosphorylase 1 [Dufourea novaeangliae]|uniref:GDP-D-glucose phosphorylase 1 n=1 Tax=Dufourea novaeangliae TaxID=178035 RepID=A0A154PDL4_DUFNO|nr:GDP-D-glucose phosphorylase 1 [Dufourea novaeangliae]